MTANIPLLTGPIDISMEAFNELIKQINSAINSNSGGAAAAGTLTGTTLATNVVNSSLTGVGTLANLTVTNPISGSLSGNASTSSTVQPPQFSILNCGNAGGGNNIKTLSPSPAISGYVTGQLFSFIGNLPNNGSSVVTLNVNGKGAVEVKKLVSGNALSPLGIGEITSNGTSIVIYDGTNFILLNPCNTSQFVNKASSSTISFFNYGAVDGGNYGHITGVTGIDTINIPNGSQVTTVFDGVLVLTNSANLILLGGANITTAAGDIATWSGEPSLVTRMISYQRAAIAP